MALNLTTTGKGVAISQGFSVGFSQGFSGPIIKQSGYLMLPIDFALAGQMPQPNKAAMKLDGGMDNIMRSVFRE